jgi:hypothetical protein
MVSKEYGKTTVEFKEGFVSQALLKILEAYNVLCVNNGTAPVANAHEIFDIVYTAEQKFFNSGRRTRGKVPVKNIATVVNMLREIKGKNISLADLENRIFFFDDDSTHELKKQISKLSYIAHLNASPKLDTFVTVIMCDKSTQKHRIMRLKR